MTLLYPIFLYLMLPVTLILFYFIMTNAHQSFTAFDKEVLQRLKHENKSLSAMARNSLFLMAFIFMIIAMSQPVFKEGEITVEAKSADILVGIDISDSMKAQDRFPNRLEFAKQKAIELIKMAPHNRIGVLAFAKHDYIVSPLSFDHSSVAFLLSKVNTRNITEKGTHLDSMLHSAISMLEHADTKNLLIFTDGGDTQDFSKQIALAKENGLRLFIIGVGTIKGSPVPSEEGGFVKDNGNILISKLNTEIEKLATKTGGVYIESVLGNEDITTMLQEIESITEKSTLKEEKIPQYIQLFYYPLAFSILFLLLAFASVPKRFSKHLVLLVLIAFGYEDARAGLLDFKKLQEAKEAYGNEKYKESASIYEGFAMESPEAVYNLGNSLYKDKDYEGALKVFNKVSQEESSFKASALHNAGNAQVKLQMYEDALQSYEQALALKEDKQTRENYEAVKKFLEEKKQEEQEKQDQQNQDQNNKDQENQDQQNKDQNNNNQKNQDQKDKDSQKQQDSQNKEDANNQQKSDKQDQEKKEKQKQEQSQKENEQDSQEKKQSEKQKGSQENKQEEKESKASEAKQKSEEKEKTSSKEAQEAQVKAVNMKEMSDLEAKKWINLIKKSQKGHLYKMQEVEHKEDSNEKPW